MAQRGLSLLDMLAVLRSCRVLGCDLRDGAWRYQVHGRSDDTLIGMAVEIEERDGGEEGGGRNQLVIVSVWKK